MSRFLPGYHRPDMRQRQHAPKIMRVDDLTVTVVRKRVKNLNLRIQPPGGEVHLSAPLGTPESEIVRLLRQRRDWIDRHRRRFQRLPAPSYREYVSGERVTVLDETRVLRYVSARSPYEPGEEQVWRIEVPLGADREARRRALERHLRREAKERFAAEVARWEPRLGVSVAQLGIKRMKTRWGTCNPTARRVWLNLALLERPGKCLEYVVVHELAHLLVPDHSPAFWAVVEHHLPAWRDAKAMLERSPLWLEHPAN